MSNSHYLRNQSLSPDADFEISLMQIMQFLGGSWRTILLFGFLGLIGSICFLFITPTQYEVTAQIKMAQISLANTANPFGTLVEDPASLVARMQMPTNYSSEVIAACGYQGVSQAALQLSKALKLSVPKGVTNIVELRVFAKSPEIAKSCALALVDQVALLQMQLAKPLVEEARIKLVQDSERIEDARKLISKSAQSVSAISVTYLLARDEIAYLLIDREKMLDLINSVDQRGAKLISPIYAPEKPVSPRIAISLLIGFLVGALIGLGIALVRQTLASMRSKK